LLPPHATDDPRVARILIIDADPAGPELVAQVVTELGHTVTGLEDMASGPGPDLALVDPADPAALSAALTLRRERDLPIVCVSSTAPAAEVGALDPCAFLCKPLRARLLDWAIADALALEPVLVAA
jgi:ABC-type sugar transport system substrate-binding protein